MRSIGIADIIVWTVALVIARSVLTGFGRGNVASGNLGDENVTSMVRFSDGRVGTCSKWRQLGCAIAIGTLSFSSV